MNVLVLNQWNVFPPATGGAHAVYELCSGISKNHECTLAFLDEGVNDTIFEKVSGGFTLARLPAKSLRAKHLRFLVPNILFKDSVVKLSLRSRFSVELREKINVLAQAADVIVVSHPWVWPLLREVDGWKNKPLVYDAHNVEAKLAEQSLRMGLRNRFHIRAAQKIESDLCRFSDLILCCSEDDKEEFFGRFGVPLDKMEVGFKGVDCSKYLNSCRQGFYERRRATVFVGSDWAPNNQAVEIICNQIGPNLPDWEHWIVGSCSRHACCDSGFVKPLGFVDDLDSVLDKAFVALNPIVSGSGINMKVLEYMAAGLPVVTTLFGARGIVGRTREAMVICDIEDFPSAVSRLYANPFEWISRSEAGMAAVREEYDWSVIGKRLDGFISDLFLKRSALNFSS